MHTGRLARGVTPIFAVVLVAMLFPIIPVLADTTIEIDCEIDAWIMHTIPDNNYGTDSYSYVGNAPQNERYTYFRFNFSTVPENIVIIDAKLYIMVNQQIGRYAGDALQLWSAGSNWSETTITWNNKPDLISPISDYFDEGGTSVIFDWLEATNEDFGIFSDERYRTSDNMTCVVRGIDMASSDYLKFYSNDHFMEERRPYLEITYTTLFFTSEPTTQVKPESVYEYLITASIPTINISYESSADFLLLTDDLLHGVPQIEDIGTYWVNITGNYSGQSDIYQNYTFDVAYGPGDSISPLVIISLALGFGALGLAIVQWPFMFLAGLIFIGAGLFLFIPYGAWVTILSLGFGMMLLAEGGVKASEG